MSWYGVFCWCCCALLVGAMWANSNTPPLTILALVIIVSYNIRAMLGAD